MDEAELDNWYNQEKESAFQEFLRAVNEGKKREEAELRYKRRMQRARERYDALYEKIRKPGPLKRAADQITKGMSGLVKIYKE